MSSVNIIICGIVWLGSALVAAQAEPTPPVLIFQWAAYWLGGLMVIVGTGKLIFVDD